MSGCRSPSRSRRCWYMFGQPRTARTPAHSPHRIHCRSGRHRRSVRWRRRRPGTPCSGNRPRRCIPVRLRRQRTRRRSRCRILLRSSRSPSTSLRRRFAERTRRSGSRGSVRRRHGPSRRGSRCRRSRGRSRLGSALRHCSWQLRKSTPGSYRSDSPPTRHSRRLLGTVRKPTPHNPRPFRQGRRPRCGTFRARSARRSRPASCSRCWRHNRCPTCRLRSWAHRNRRPTPRCS